MNEARHEGPLTPFALRARWVAPVAGPPIENGCVTVRGDRILAVGRETTAATIKDLGDVALLPGLVNAHAHFDLCDAPGRIGQPGMNLVDWLMLVIEHRIATPRTEEAVVRGLRESVHLGATTVADISQAVPPLDTLRELGVSVIGFLELIGATRDRVEAQITRAEAYLAEGRGTALWQAGLSPHAPYSIYPDLLTHIVALSAEHHVPLAMHLAESPEEIELIEHRSGPFRDFQDKLGAWDPTAFPDGLSILAYLQTLAGGHRAIVIHGNYLIEPDIAFVAEHADRMAVVYCPRTHTFFDHAPYPLEQMLTVGVPVALGTDSRASSPDLSILAEMREAHRRHPSIAPEAIIRMGTLGGAVALGLSHSCGTIQPGRRADLTAIALPDAPCATVPDLYHGLLEGDTRVTETWIAGCSVGSVF
jgi:cytosine/adenosine deaminase-related metal-dependent hydrolase